MVSGAAGHDHGCSSHSLDGDMHEPMLSGAEPERHQLLAALQADDRQRWHPHLEPVQLRSGQVLCEAGDTPAHVHFPISAVISLVSMTHDGGSAELAVVGHDGVVGIAVFMGGNAMPGQAVVQAGGLALRLRTPTLKSLLQRAGPALAMLLRYTQALMTHVAQTVLCNRFHAIDQQLCRRLLLGLDRGGSDELVMTHEDTARLLGVRREGVTAAALGLQRAGVIRYHRGHIHVLDRGALERRACECYAAARSEYARLLPRPAALDGSIAMSCA
jgi:CRP-like cAMP-binding protein